ncbi:DUF998 domain-containing protein [Georgenia subflava]|uniref:DUF998 domain-containing protein n=1 Tax=Georgenia subflava TaxID=1622177 RepID=A0A6N7ELU8_9MICO|nr:DUF998 domain-containing protein [Georgenia subflava]MPV38088.1 DUF998 domain-containing protein [Georgenia subflava]
MSTTTPRVASPSRVTSRTTGRLLAGAMLAAPLFVGVAATQVLARDGFDLTRHPLSLLSTGPGGWVQIANFVLTGLLVIGFAVGLRRMRRSGRAGTWGPILFGVLGVGLVAAGVFVADPGLGFPPGTPEVTEPTWHGTAHNIAALLATDPATIGCVVLARRFSRDGERRWAVASVAMAVAVLLVGWWPDPGSISIRLAVVVTLLLGYVSLVAAKLRREMAPR